jgi:hypothetical protein
MIVDVRGDLCSGTALTQDLVLTAAHCVVRTVDYQVKTLQTGQTIGVRSIAVHPKFDLESYAVARATADFLLVKLAAPLMELVAPTKLSPSRRVTIDKKLSLRASV